MQKIEETTTETTSITAEGYKALYLRPGRRLIKLTSHQPKRMQMAEGAKGTTPETWELHSL
jgi:hypothetical protein